MRIGTGFKKITIKRPVVVREGDVVKVCYFYQGMRECLGFTCYWQKVGKCPIFEKLYKKNAK
ncbi:MAG TPA: hypothetical protein EYH56_02410 [Nanoarchaeota archaeon]|nr:hypothetical protein [Nanoarchaeota archaeon]